jgi:hypothetical protein
MIPASGTGPKIKSIFTKKANDAPRAAKQYGGRRLVLATLIEMEMKRNSP